MKRIPIPHIRVGDGVQGHPHVALHTWALDRVRHVSWNTVIVAALTVFAVTVLLVALAEIGFDELASAFVNASPLFLALAFLAAQSRFLALVVALRGAMGHPLPWWRTTQLQYAIQMFALATPGDAARLVMTVNFAEKCGASREEAIGKAPLATVSGWFVDFAILLVAGIAVGTGVHGSAIIGDLEGVWPILVTALAALVAGVLAVIFVRQIRRRVIPPLVSVITETWRSLKSPEQVVQIFGAGLVERLAYGTSLMAAVAATGHGITLWEAVLVGGGALVAGGLIPTPGGIGVSEGALAAGMVLMGVPEASAIAAGLISRSFNIYLPPVYGFFALRELRRIHLL